MTTRKLQIFLQNNLKCAIRPGCGTKIAISPSVMRFLSASRCFKDNRGFTLIELLIVMAILTLAVGIGVPMYHLTIKPTANLNGAARQLHSDIQLARLRAVSRNVRCGVVFSAGPSYTLFVDENDDSLYDYTDDGDDTNDEEVIKTFNLGSAYSGVQFDTAEGGGDGINFATNSFAMTPRGIPTASGEVYLKNDRGEGRKIIVNSMGGVRLEKY